MARNGGDARLIAGRYQLTGRLGRGGMGTVWRAHDELLGRQVAVKELHLDEGLSALDAQVQRERTLREARTVAQLKHPHVIVLHDVVEQDERPWIVMELVDGRSLADQLAEQGPVEQREAARIGLALLDALGSAHARGVLHRDIKPANVLMEAGTGRVVLTDFGIAQVAGATTITETGTFVGSPEYTAPERMSGRRTGPESDLWSLGVLLCTLVSGESPFRRDSLGGVLHAVVFDEIRVPVQAGPLSPVILGLLSRDPTRRLTTASASTLLGAYAANPPSDDGLPLPAGAFAPRGAFASRGGEAVPRGGGAVPRGGGPPPDPRRPTVGPGPTAPAAQPATSQLGNAGHLGNADHPGNADHLGATGLVRAAGSPLTAGRTTAARATPDPAPYGGYAPAAGPSPTDPVPAPGARGAGPGYGQAAPAVPTPGPAGEPVAGAAPTAMAAGAHPDHSAAGPHPVNSAAGAPAAGADRAGSRRGRRLTRGRTAGLAATAVLALAGLAAGAVVLLDDADGDGDGTHNAQGDQTTPGGAREGDQAGERGDADQPPRTPTDRPPSGPATVPTAAPAGYELVNDPAGFRIAVPKGYVRSYEPPRVYYYSPGKAFRIGIHPQTLDPRGSVRVMREAHAEGAQRYEGYRDGRVTETTHHGLPAALWEFTWDGAQDDGGARRTYDLSWEEGGRMYDIWVSAPIAEKAQGKRHFTTLVDTFDRPGARY